MDPTGSVLVSGPASSMASQLGLQAGAQVGQGILGFLGQRWQNKHNMRLVKDAQAHELAMWQKQADYNSPVAQMERLREAGLNPHLVYGKPGEASGNMGNKPQTFIPEVQNELENIQLPMAMDLLRQVQDYKNSKETEQLIQARRIDTFGSFWLKDIERERREALVKAGVYELEIQKLRSSLNLLDAGTERTRQEARLKKVEADLNEVLKQHGITQNDHIGIRAIFMLMESLGIPVKSLLPKVD